MREVAKSMLGFSWAVSLFGVQQMAKLVTPSSEPSEATAAQFDEATRLVQGFLSGTVARQFRAGDEWQRRMVDTVCDAAALQGLDPRRLADTLDPRPFIENLDARQVLKNGVDAMQQSFESVRQAVTPQSVN
jgi:hypothetical protein